MLSDDVILYHLPEQAEAEFKLLLVEGAPLDYAAEGAGRIAVAMELRAQADQIMASIDQVAGDPDEDVYLDAATTHAHMLRKRTDYLHPEGADS